MKDIIVSVKAQKRELIILLCCFVAAVGLNVFAIIKYVRPASELISQIGFVIVIAIIIYLLLWMLRLIVIGLTSIFCYLCKSAYSHLFMADNYLENKRAALDEREAKERKKRQEAYRKRMDAYLKKMKEEQK